MGGLTHLQYNVTIDTSYADLDNVLSTSTNSVVAYIPDPLRVWINVIVVDSVDGFLTSRQLSEYSPLLYESNLQSYCVGEGICSLVNRCISNVARKFSRFIFYNQSQT